MDTWIKRALTCPAILCLLLAGAPIPAAHASTTIIVNTTSGGLVNGDGLCSLYEAIVNANNDAATYPECLAGSGEDTIVFDDLLGTAQITLTGYLLGMTDTQRTTIDGGGDITVDGNNTYPVFSTAAVTTIQDIAIAHGREESGAGLWVSAVANATVRRSTFIGNTTTGSDLLADGGGAIFSYGTLWVGDSTFQGNSTVAQGGAIHNFGGLATISNSTFSGNSASGGLNGNRGGAIFTQNSAGPIGSTWIYTSTFSANSADAGTGADVHNEQGVLHLYNTILGNGVSGENCRATAGTTVVGNSNLIEDATSACGFSNGVLGNIVGSDPGLAASLSGPAPLHFLLNPGSPAIDSGDSNLILGYPTLDQIGNPRPIDVPWVTDTGIGGVMFTDMGSIEMQPGSLTFRSIGTQDGWILESSETSGSGGTLNSTDTQFNLGDDAADRQYRAILSFNTASLPDDAIIATATLKIKRTGLVGSDPFGSSGNLMIDIKTGPFSGNAALQLTDFRALASKNYAMKFTNTPVGVWYSSAMPAANLGYVNRVGGTQARLRFYTGDNDDMGADYLRFASGNAITTSRPTFIINYFVP